MTKPENGQSIGNVDSALCEEGHSRGTLNRRFSWALCIGLPLFIRLPVYYSLDFPTLPQLSSQKYNLPIPEEGGLGVSACREQGTKTTGNPFPVQNTGVFVVRERG